MRANNPSKFCKLLGSIVDDTHDISLTHDNSCPKLEIRRPRRMPLHRHLHVLWHVMGGPFENVKLGRRQVTMFPPKVFCFGNTLLFSGFEVGGTLQVAIIQPELRA